MNRFLIFLLLLTVGFKNTIAQTIDFTHYERLKCAGPIPKDFTTQSLQKYDEARKQIDSTHKNQQKLIDQFYLENSYGINSMLLSGRVIFGDPVTKYLNSIKDDLLKDDPTLRDQIRVYTLRSTDVNAFTTSQGIVCVTTGLLSQVENEAQVAYVLCHEFVHYKNKHQLNEYVENATAVKKQGIYRNLSREDVDLYQFKYSKDMEMEADLNGLETYKKSGYSLNVIDGVFNVLLYSYLPFDEVEFNKRFFEDNTYTFPKNYTKDKLSPITAEEDFNDDKSTHPNVKKRKAAALESAKGFNNEGRKLFIQPKENFLNVQKICRYESCLLYLKNEEYENAIYSAYILLQNDSTNLFLKKMVVRGLYGLTMYRNADETPGNHQSYSDIEGTSQQLFYFLYKLPDREMNILALKKAWAVHQLDPDDKDITKICNDLVHGLVYKNSMEYDDFESQYLTTTTAPADTTTQSQLTAPPSKYDKIKQKKVASEVEVKYYKYAFVSYANDTAFKKLFRREETAYHSDDLLAKKKKRTDAERELIRKKGYALNMDNILIVNPIYYKYDDTKSSSVKYVASEEALNNLHDQIKEEAQKIGISVDFIEGNNLTESDADKFNNMALLNEWIGEQVDHPNFKMVNTTNNEFIKIASAYPTQNFSWMGVISVKEKKDFPYQNICAAIIWFPLAPYIIYKAVAPQYRSYFFTIVVDGKTGQMKMDYVNRVNMKDISSVQSQNIYYILQQIKKKRE